MQKARGNMVLTGIRLEVQYGWLRRTEARVGITGSGWEQVVAALLDLNGNVYSGCSMGNGL